MYTNVHQLLFVLTITILTTFTVGCRPDPAPRVMNMAIGEEPSTLDLHRTSESTAAEVFQYVCEPLFYQDADRTYQPLLADTWIYAADGTSLDLTLRSNVRFHNGVTLDANAVRYTFERLQNEASFESPLYDRFQNLTLEVVDDKTVRFRFAEPTFDFLSVLSTSYAAIIAPETGESDTFATQPICTGPFKVAEWIPSQKIVLQRHDEYAWAPQFLANHTAPHLDQIQIYVMESQEVRFAAFLNGELDLLSLGSPEEITRLQEEDKGTLHESFINGITFVGFNYQGASTSEPLVRQALAHAIDKQLIIDTVLPGMAVPAQSPLAPTIPGYAIAAAEAGYIYDPARSQALLAEAGFRDTNGDGIVERQGQPFTLKLLTTTSNTYAKVFTLLQAQFRAIGVEVEIQAVPAEEIADITPTGDFDVLLYHYNWSTPDALQLFLGTERIGASNRVAYSNLEVDELVAESLRYDENNPERLERLEEAQEIIVRDAPWQPLLVRKRIIAVSDRVAGFQMLPTGQIWFNDIQISDESTTQ